MRDLRHLIDGTSVLAFTGEGDGTRWKRVPLKAVEEDVYGKLARRRRKAQMAARRALGIHDDMARPLAALSGAVCCRLKGAERARGR